MRTLFFLLLAMLAQTISQAQFIGISDNWEYLDFPYTILNEFQISLKAYEDTVHDVAYLYGKFREGPEDSSNAISCNMAMVQYDGLNFQTIGHFSNIVLDVESFNSDIYAGGIFACVEGNPDIKFLAKYDGLEWSSAGVFNGGVGAMVSTDEYLYVAGSFTEIDGVAISRIARYNGTVWEALPSGGFSSGTYVRDLEYYDDELHACGNIKFENDPNESIGILVMHDDEWIELADGVLHDFLISNLEIWQGDLYLSGDYFVSNFPLHQALLRWDGESLSAPWPGFYDINGNVSYGSLPNFLIGTEDHLYVGGSMDYIGDQNVNQLAAYNGDEFCAMYTFYQNGPMIGMFSFRDTLYARLIQNPFSYSLYPSGLFKWVGGDDFENCYPLSAASRTLKNDDIVLFPNPVRDILSVRNNTSQLLGLSIFSYNSQRIAITGLVNAGLSIEVDLSSQASGFYFMNFENEVGETVTKKIIKL